MEHIKYAIQLHHDNHLSHIQRTGIDNNLHSKLKNAEKKTMNRQRERINNHEKKGKNGLIP